MFGPEEKIAEIAVNYSLGVKKGDRVMVNTDVAGIPLAREIVKSCLKRGSRVWTEVHSDELKFALLKHSKTEQLKWVPEHTLVELKNADVWIYVIAPEDTRIFSEIPPRRLSLYQRAREEVLNYPMRHTRWLFVLYPTRALAKEAGMRFADYRRLIFSSIIQDWKKYGRWKTLAELLELSDRVEIYGEGTELKFSVKGRKALVFRGRHNLPDGEILTSVVENSVEGRVYFDVPSVYCYQEVRGATLVFKKGKVVKASARIGEPVLKSILGTDSGSKRLGEFGIGVNYALRRYTKNILVDEKIGGTVHLALGNGYRETLSKNVSGVHWDLIKDMRKEGEIYFDGSLVFRKGRWLKV